MLHGARAGAKACENSGEFENLKERVASLEVSMRGVKDALFEIKANSDEILTAVKLGKGIVGFARKHSGAILAFAVGAGFMNDNLKALLMALIS